MPKSNTNNLTIIECDNGSLKLIIYNFVNRSGGFTSRNLVKSCFGIPAYQMTFDYIKENVDEVFNRFPNQEIHELLNKLN